MEMVTKKHPMEMVPDMLNFGWISQALFRFINLFLWPIKIKTKLRDPMMKPNDKLVTSMMLLGFERDESYYSLQLTGNDVEKAVNLLLLLSQT